MQFHLSAFCKQIATRRHSAARRAALGMSAVLLSACGPDLAHDTPEERRHGAALYAVHCAACHGSDARGGGAASLGLGGPPPDLTNLAARFGGAFPRDYVMSTIDGSERRGRPDEVMPTFGDGHVPGLALPAHSQVTTPVPQDLMAITTYLAHLQVP